jgi:hypothetical protein
MLAYNQQNTKMQLKADKKKKEQFQTLLEKVNAEETKN